MKKMMILVAVVAMAVGACGKKKDTATPAAPVTEPAPADPAADPAAEPAADPAADPAAAPAEGM